MSRIRCIQQTCNVVYTECIIRHLGGLKHELVENINWKNYLITDCKYKKFGFCPPPFMFFQTLSCPFPPFNVHSPPFSVRQSAFMFIQSFSCSTISLTFVNLLSCSSISFHDRQSPFMFVNLLSCSSTPFHVRQYPFMLIHPVSCS